MGNTANLGLFVVHKIISKYTERIFTYMEKTQRDTKVRISRLMMVQHEFFLDSYFLYSIRWVDFSQKKPFLATFPLQQQ
jgi:hypothetical protein